MLPLVFLVGIGTHAGWKRASFGRTRTLLTGVFGVAVVLGVVLATAIYPWHSVMTAVGFIAAFWVGLASLIEPVQRWRNDHSLPAGVVGMSVAHFGLAIFILGATTVESYKVETDQSLQPGQSTQVAGYDFKMTNLREVSGPNYEAIESEIVISRDGKQIAVLHPQKRTYRVQTNAMTEAGIDLHWHGDLFAAMGEPLGNGAWSVRLQYKPLVSFLWLGAFVIALGGGIAACDRRYKQKAPVQETSPAQSAVKTV
jgi:cytochrome c-type biogenesis protein CcmF